MRAPASPFANPDHYDAIKKNLVNGNSGNLLFVHSIVRAILLDDVQIDYIKIKEFEKEKMEAYNQEYDAFIIPLANAFRTGFIGELEVLTQMVNALDMPCVVIGVGSQTNIGEKENIPKLDNAVKNFCDAVLKKSASIGIRGEITADYLERLGYVRNQDFVVIGCPSMYLYGDVLPEPKKFVLSKNLRVNLNCKVTLPQNIHDFMDKVRDEFPNHYYIPQNHYELKFMYSQILFKELKNAKIPINYPHDFSHPLYTNNRVRGFVSAEAWFTFLKKGDLNLGTRIHGNIAGILSGVPTFIVAPDSRVLELAEYHNIPHVSIKDISGSTDLYELLNGVDFNQVLIGHKERFQKYLRFLNDNGLQTIFNKQYDVIPFDREIKNIRFRGPIVPFPYAKIRDKKNGRHMYLEFYDTSKKRKPPLIKRIKRRIRKLLNKGKSNV